MGASTSRAAVRTASQNGSVGRAASEVQAASANQMLEQLPTDSAVRRDAAYAAEYKAWRSAQEQGADAIAALEQQSERDPQLNDMMQQAMQRTEGRIQYQEHFLPMPDSTQTVAMVQEVCPEALAQLNPAVVCNRHGYKKLPGVVYAM